MARKRYLFFDIDGTLTTGAYGKMSIPDSAKEALTKLREAGHFLAIATGRAHAMAAEYMEELGFDNMVSDGGMGITINGELQEIIPLNRADAIALIRECQQKDYAWGIQVEDSKERFVPDDRFMAFTHDVYMSARVITGLDPEDYPQIYKAYVACYAPDEQRLESLKKLPWARFHKEYIFVEPTDKARGIRQMMDYYNADYADAVVFGDADNDLSMFIDDWTCVAMGNAVPALKSRADYITTDVDKNGIYNACEALGLFEPVNK